MSYKPRPGEDVVSRDIGPLGKVYMLRTVVAGEEWFAPLGSPPFAEAPWGAWTQFKDLPPEP